jgi:hypothetical protein
MDTNGNGAIDRNEWTRDAAMFDRLDTNRDNRVTQAEMQQAWQNHEGQGKGKNKGQRFAGMDRDGNGVITRDEWRGNDQSFRNQDTNGDNVLSGSELQGKGQAKHNKNQSR